MKREGGEGGWDEERGEREGWRKREGRGRVRGREKGGI